MVVHNDGVDLKHSELYSIFIVREILNGFKCVRECKGCLFQSVDDICNLQFVATVLDEVIGGVFND